MISNEKILRKIILEIINAELKKRNLLAEKTLPDKDDAWGNWDAVKMPEPPPPGPKGSTGGGWVDKLRKKLTTLNPPDPEEEVKSQGKKVWTKEKYDAYVKKKNFYMKKYEIALNKQMAAEEAAGDNPAGQALSLKYKKEAANYLKKAQRLNRYIWAMQKLKDDKAGYGYLAQPKSKRRRKSGKSRCTGKGSGKWKMPANIPYKSFNEFYTALKGDTAALKALGRKDCRWGPKHNKAYGMLKGTDTASAVAGTVLPPEPKCPPGQEAYMIKSIGKWECGAKPKDESLAGLKDDPIFNWSGPGKTENFPLGPSLQEQRYDRLIDRLIKEIKKS
jgi:hypothetical protein